MDDHKLFTLNRICLNELPDPNQSLATQVILDKFTLFSELPSELRRQIWRHALPPGMEVALFIRAIDQRRPRTRPFPTLTKVNREARTVALENYIVPRRHVPPRRKGIIPEGWQERFTTCFDPSVDILYVDLRIIFFDRFEEAMQNLAKTQSHRLDKIKVLNIGTLYQNKKDIHNLLVDADLRKRALVPARCVRFFRQLDEIRVGFQVGPALIKELGYRNWKLFRGGSWEDDGRKEFQAHLTRFFEEENARIGKCKIPKFVFNLKPRT